MKDGIDILVMNNIKNEKNFTRIGDESSKRKPCSKQELPKLVEHIPNKKFDEIINNSDNLEGEGVEKFIIPSNIIDIYTRLEVILGKKLSGHTNTLTEAGNLNGEFYKRGEIQNERQYENALEKL